MVSCLKGCGYKSEMRLAMIKHTSSVRLEPVILESVNQQKKQVLWLPHKTVIWA